MSAASARWRALRFGLPAAREDAFVAACWAAGALGFEVRSGESAGDVEIVVWAADPVPDALVRFDGGSWSARLLGEDSVGDEDWLVEHRRWAAPFDLGVGFRVDPGDPGDRAPDDSVRDDTAPAGSGLQPSKPRAVSSVPGRRRLLSIPARTAFGTGSHESTRLAVELLEETPLDRRSVLDVGTGSGILAFVALVLGARCAVGFDVDPIALPIARDNARRNDLEPKFFAGRVTALASNAAFDVVVVNALPHEVRDELPRFAAHLAPRGRLIVSGVPTEQTAGVEERLEDLGFRLVRTRELGEWTGLALTRGSGSGAVSEDVEMCGS